MCIRDSPRIEKIEDRHKSRVGLHIGYKGNGNVTLNFLIVYKGTELIKINRFKLISDDMTWQSEKIKFSRRKAGLSASERYENNATPELIELANRIANSKSSVITFQGKKGNKEMTVSEQQKISIKEMLKLYQLMSS